MTLPHLSNRTTARTVPPRNVGDLYADPVLQFILGYNLKQNAFYLTQFHI